MKFGVSYNLFDGEELLKYAIQSIRDQVEFITVVYQRTSNKGEKTDLSFEWIHLVDDAINYEPDLSLSPRENETAKRNLGRLASLKNGCDYHASMDVDEFYTPDMMKHVRKMNEDMSVCQYSNYFKSPRWKVVPIEKFMVTLFHRPEYRYDMSMPYPYMVDATRKVAGWKTHRVFIPSEVEMQHMSYIRKDIEKKIRNSSSTEQFGKILDVYNKYQLGEDLCIPPSKEIKKTIEVSNRFNIEV